MAALHHVADHHPRPRGRGIAPTTPTAPAGGGSTARAARAARAARTARTAHHPAVRLPTGVHAGYSTVMLREKVRKQRYALGGLGKRTADDGKTLRQLHGLMWRRLCASVDPYTPINRDRVRGRPHGADQDRLLLCVCMPANMSVRASVVCCVVN